jgi:hypothetical protein
LHSRFAPDCGSFAAAILRASYFREQLGRPIAASLADDVLRYFSRAA